jgi:cytoskeletal protein CcmA (bactofilin family)
VNRREKADSFQRQVSALREQLSGGGHSDDEPFDDAEPMLPDDAPAILSSTPARTVGQVYAPAAPVGSTSIPRLDAATGVIAADSRWNGVLESNGSLHVYGVAEGEISAQGDVYIAEGARVEARLRASNVYVAGVVNGTIDCARRLEVLPSGQVGGDVTAPTLVVHDGALLSGSLHMTSSDTDGHR